VRVIKGIVTVALVIAAASVLASRNVGPDALMLPGGLAAAGCAVVLVSLIGAPGSAQIEPDGTTTLDRAATGLVLLVWPALAALALRGLPAAAGALAAAIAIAVFAARLPVGILALGAGALAYGASRLRRGRTRFALGILFAALILLCPLIPLAVKAAGGNNLPDVAAPLKIWGDILAADRARILTGHGLDTATRGIAYGYLPARTPHSLLFEIWYELGIVGATLAALFTYRVFMALGRAPRVIAPYLLAGFTTGLVVTILGLGTAQVWWLTLVGLDVLAFAVTANGHYGKRPSIIVRPPVEAMERR
jgi:O-antigen ligase